ncbi:MAG: peptide chain release factor N(5)-glutamine methyltransferase [Candidatus Eisenbacteria bacterium]|nr:peptide chain release factor N(5)-glutamine methyltransferase [Candidatus Eisenbacteria bacterium]
MAKKTWTVLELIDWTRAYLAERGFENARLETELLLGHALNLPRIELYLNYNRQMDEDELKRYKVLLKRRLAGEPVQYVTGTAAFMLSDFEVGPNVLIPRPETEALTEVAIELLEEAGLRRRQRGARAVESGQRPDDGPEALLADVGTGSGVIAVTLAQEFPGARVLATDSSADALEVAARNAGAAGVGDRVEFLEGELLKPLFAEVAKGKLLALVSNPPYVASGQIEQLPPEVRDFEPRRALDGGPDGLDCLRAIAQDGAALLVPDGVIVLEVGDGQAEAVAAMLGESFGSSEIRTDYAGRDRIVVGRRPGQR